MEVSDFRRISTAASMPPAASAACASSKGTRAACGLPRLVRIIPRRRSRTPAISSLRFARASAMGLLSMASTIPICRIVHRNAMYNERVTSPRKTETRHHPEGKTCFHFTRYRLTCDEYDALRARANGRCEICGTPEGETAQRRLVIDHFHAKNGASFVRGLLCDRCNNEVMACVDGVRPWGAYRDLEANGRKYEANSWQTPSPAAMAQMAVRQEMHPRRRRPRQTPDRSRTSVIVIPSRRGTAVMAESLRDWLTPEELAELVTLLAQGHASVP